MKAPKIRVFNSEYHPLKNQHFYIWKETSMKSKKTLLAAALGAAILTAGSPVLAQDMTFFRIASGSAGGT